MTKLERSVQRGMKKSKATEVSKKDKKELKGEDLDAMEFSEKFGKEIQFMAKRKENIQQSIQVLKAIDLIANTKNS